MMRYNDRALISVRLEASTSTSLLTEGSYQRPPRVLHIGLGRTREGGAHVAQHSVKDRSMRPDGVCCCTTERVPLRAQRLGDALAG